MAVAIHRAGNVQRLHGADPAVALLRQVAQVLERLGVALAHHIGAGVAVKHPQQLPGIAVGCVLVDAGVVGDLVADILPVCLQLAIVGLAAVGGYHLLGYRHRRRHVGIVGGVQAAAAELRGHREAERNVLPAVIRYVRIADAHRLVVPVQRIRQIRQQRLPHLVRRGLIRQRARGLDHRVLPLSVGDQDQLLLQGVVHRPLRRRQVPGCGVHGRCAGRVEAPFIVGDVHACQLVQIAVQQRAVGCRLRTALRRHSLHRQQRQGHDQRQQQRSQVLLDFPHSSPPHVFTPRGLIDLCKVYHRRWKKYTHFSTFFLLFAQKNGHRALIPVSVSAYRCFSGSCMSRAMALAYRSSSLNTQPQYFCI